MNASYKYIWKPVWLLGKKTTEVFDETPPITARFLQWEPSQILMKENPGNGTQECPDAGGIDLKKAAWGLGSISSLQQQPQETIL
jgi:hypothetical protein